LVVRCNEPWDPIAMAIERFDLPQSHQTGDSEIKSPSGDPSLGKTDNQQLGNGRACTLDEMLEQKYGPLLGEKLRSRANQSSNDKTSLQGLTKAKIEITCLDQNDRILRTKLSNFIQGDLYFRFVAARGSEIHFIKDLSSQIRNEIKADNLFHHIRINDDYLRQVANEKLLQLSRRSDHEQLDQVLSDDLAFQDDLQNGIKVLGAEFFSPANQGSSRFWALAELHYIRGTQALIDQRPETLVEMELDLRRSDSISRCLATCRVELENISGVHQIKRELAQSINELSARYGEVRSSRDQLVHSSRTVAKAQRNLAMAAQSWLSILAKDFEALGLTAPAAELQALGNLIVADADEEAVGTDDKPLSPAQKMQVPKQLEKFEARMVKVMDQRWERLVKKYYISTNLQSIAPGNFSQRSLNESLRLYRKNQGLDAASAADSLPSVT
jgi:hypothetical protein